MKKYVISIAGNDDDYVASLPAVPIDFEVDSQGNVEVKRKVNKRHFQLISIAVVASFTEHNRHPALNSAVPVILMNANHAFVAIYDCQLDIFLRSTPLIFKPNATEINKEASLVLWLAINHR